MVERSISIWHDLLWKIDTLWPINTLWSKKKIWKWCRNDTDGKLKRPQTERSREQKNFANERVRNGALTLDERYRWQVQ